MRCIPEGLCLSQTAAFIIFKEVHISNILRNRIHFIKAPGKSSKVRVSKKHSTFYQSLQNDCSNVLLKAGEQLNITWSKFRTVGMLRGTFETYLCQYKYLLNCEFPYCLHAQAAFCKFVRCTENCSVFS